jgi:hypothetical protein
MGCHLKDYLTSFGARINPLTGGGKVLNIENDENPERN